MIRAGQREGEAGSTAPLSVRRERSLQQQQQQQQKRDRRRRRRGKTRPVEGGFAQAAPFFLSPRPRLKERKTGECYCSAKVNRDSKRPHNVRIMRRNRSWSCWKTTQPGFWYGSKLPMVKRLLGHAIGIAYAVPCRRRCSIAAVNAKSLYGSFTTKHGAAIVQEKCSKNP